MTVVSERQKNTSEKSAVSAYAGNKTGIYAESTTYANFIKKAMNLTAQIAKQFRDVHYGGNWTTSNLKENLADINWQMATTKLYSFNTIAALVYHMNYYVGAVLKVLNGGPLDANDKYSFDHPSILCQEDWEKLLNKTWTDAENFASLVERLPERELWETFSDKKYGNYYRNMQGVTEHIHYHLGQIVLIRKVLQKDHH